MRRGTFREGTVNYAAVGATSAPDLMHYPPEGSTPAEQSWRIGSGEDRFRHAADALLSWKPQRVAGLQVSDVRPAAGPVYSGVSFDADGNPIAPNRDEPEQRFDAEGTPYAAPGMTLRLHGRVNGMRGDAEIRVISVIESARQVTLVLGTVDDSVVSGEELFDLVWREDNDEVWFSVRAFDTAQSMLYRIVPGLVKRRRRALFGQYLRAISPMYATSV
ncbi:DUF1990 family protein [Microbacterium sp. YY-01]|uniref:DUF1990 family protein n=1 Tax=Microbacterium sp. YY-01 TaxID=3421634 RepID=UPI003D173D55